MTCKITCCQHNYYLPTGFEMQCHYCKRPLTCADTTAIIYSHKPRPTGPELWAELHSHRWSTFTNFREWFDGWLAKVDRLPYCSCGAKFRSKILPQFAGKFCSIANDDEWLSVSVAMHNAVNASLEKKPFSMDDAIKLWRVNA